MCFYILPHLSGRHKGDNEGGRCRVSVLTECQQFKVRLANLTISQIQRCGIFGIFFGSLHEPEKKKIVYKRRFRIFVAPSEKVNVCVRDDDRGRRGGRKETAQDVRQTLLDL
jgi:hypothetical protein